jgi:hypothetical protein
MEIEVNLPALKKCTEDYLQNWMPRKEICIKLLPEEIREILEDQNKETESILITAWHFKFYLRQLFLISTKDANKNEIKKVLEETKFLMDFFSERQIRSLWGTLWLQHFLSEITDYELYDVFNGTHYYDEHLAQIAYEEYTRRKALIASPEPDKKVVVELLSLKKTKES